MCLVAEPEVREGHRRRHLGPAVAVGILGCGGEGAARLPGGRRDGERAALQPGHRQDEVDQGNEQQDPDDDELDDRAARVRPARVRPARVLTDG